jgi:hypothetical protein
MNDPTSFVLRWLVLALQVVFVVSASGQSHPLEANSVEIQGAALGLFMMQDGLPPSLVDLTDLEGTEKLKGLCNKVWEKSTKLDKGPEAIASSAQITIKVKNEAELVILAGRYGYRNNEWRESKNFEEVYKMVIHLVKNVDGVEWSPGALNTPYPTEAEKKMILERMISGAKLGR